MCRFIEFEHHTPCIVGGIYVSRKFCRLHVTPWGYDPLSDHIIPSYFDAALQLQLSPSQDASASSNYGPRYRIVDTTFERNQCPLLAHSSYQCSSGSFRIGLPRVVNV